MAYRWYPQKTYPPFFFFKANILALTMEWGQSIKVKIFSIGTRKFNSDKTWKMHVNTIFSQFNSSYMPVLTQLIWFYKVIHIFFYILYKLAPFHILNVMCVCLFIYLFTWWLMCKKEKQNNNKRKVEFIFSLSSTLSQILLTELNSMFSFNQGNI